MKKAIAASLILGLFGFGMSWWAQHQLPDDIARYRYDKPSWYDAWFSGDSPRITAQMIDRSGDKQYQGVAIHPAFQMLVYPPTKILILAGMGHLSAVKFANAVICAFWAIALFWCLFVQMRGIVAASVFTLLAQVSAASLFWFAVPETWGLGSLTLLLTFLVYAISQRKNLHPAWFIATTALSLGVTLTNGMLGGIIMLVKFGWKRTVKYYAISLAIVAVAFGIQVTLYACKANVATYQKDYIFQEESGGPGNVAVVMLLRSVVMPEIHQAKKTLTRDAGLTIQDSEAVKGFGGIALALWMLLLCSSFMHGHQDRVIWLFLAAQLALHLVYGGEETFLYALHWTPFLIMAAARGCLTRQRKWVLAIAAVLVITAGINNYQRFMEATEMVKHVAR